MGEYASYEKGLSHGRRLGVENAHSSWLAACGAVRGHRLRLARRFYIAESTVKTHLSSAFRRLGVHSRREAAAMIFASDEVLRRSVLGSVRMAGELGPRPDLR